MAMQTTSASPVKVFVAEDSAAIRERVTAMLADAAMDVVGQGATPGACIDGIRHTNPDVVVLDHQLEGGTGLEVLRAVHGFDPGIAFVVFSNSSLPAYRKRYLAEGACHFLDKATEFEQLTATVRSAGSRAAH